MATRGRSETAEQARRERAHRLNLLGTWVLARREKLEELRDLIASEIEMNPERKIPEASKDRRPKRPDCLPMKLRSFRRT